MFYSPKEVRGMLLSLHLRLQVSHSSHAGTCHCPGYLWKLWECYLFRFVFWVGFFLIRKKDKYTLSFLFADFMIHSVTHSCCLELFFFFEVQFALYFSLQSSRMASIRILYFSRFQELLSFPWSLFHRFLSSSLTYSEEFFHWYLFHFCLQM